MAAPWIFGGMQVGLRYDLRRVQCPRCGVCTELVPWAEPDWCTAARSRSRSRIWPSVPTETTVVAMMRIAWSTVGSIVSRVVGRIEPDRS